MQLVEVGRNDPCPCGSGKKYKRCCLADRDAAIAGGAGALDCAALVDAAIGSDDWSAIHGLVDLAMEVFAPGSPLEHVRFRDDLIDVREPDATDFPKLCTPGWAGRCELEIAHVLAHFELEPDIRDGLRMAAHLVRRFGATSPIVEELAGRQVAEHVARRRELADALSSRGLVATDVKQAWHDIDDWLGRVRPPLLSFADWFALHVAPDDMVEALWHAGIARRVCDVCLARLERAVCEDARSWGALAYVALSGIAGISPVGRFLAEETPLRAPTADEREVYEQLHARKGNGRDRDGILHAIRRATEERGDYAGAALLREVMRLVQSWKR